MEDVSIFAVAVKVKTIDGRDTREVLIVESVSERSRRVMTMDRDGAFVGYDFQEVTNEYFDRISGEVK